MSYQTIAACLLIAILALFGAAEMWIGWQAPDHDEDEERQSRWGAGP